MSFIVSIFAHATLKERKMLGHFTGTPSRARDVGRCLIAREIVFQEKFLDGHLAVEHQRLLGQIGDAETALPEDADNAVLTILKG